ncbi:GNAT family N-acetyltransferase [Alphaproteobacteria bacterium KMM 3653]|uniref:GNAT family N-acetyltransferase n=1 Tax=Harenicola maris TaxID=2841044 RepID=A0AAP2CM52_9RHOB|nr:GNAT family N-acetyltransferase [Harenicola maris]
MAMLFEGAAGAMHKSCTSDAHPMHMNLRRAAASDAAPCGQIVNDWIDETEWHPRVHSHASVARHFAGTVWTEREVWVYGDPAEGFVAIDNDDDMITGLYVARRRRGIGSALMGQAKAGRDRLQLWTHQPNLAAQRFYLHHGFRAVERTDGDNEEKVPDVRFEWLA